jgi:hypothetical protein
LSCVLEVLDVGVGAREEQAFVASVAPPNPEGWGSVGPDREHFGVAVRLSDSMRPDHDPISNFSSHDLTSS